MSQDPDHGPVWNADSRTAWLIGTAMLAAYLVALLPSLPTIESAAKDGRQQVVTEHWEVCDKLGMTVDSPGRAGCLNILLQRQRRHERFFVTRNSGILSVDTWGSGHSRQSSNGAAQAAPAVQVLSSDISACSPWQDGGAAKQDRTRHRRGNER